MQGVILVDPQHLVKTATDGPMTGGLESCRPFRSVDSAARQQASREKAKTAYKADVVFTSHRATGGLQNNENVVLKQPGCLPSNGKRIAEAPTKTSK